MSTVTVSTSRPWTNPDGSFPSGKVLIQPVQEVITSAATIVAAGTTFWLRNGTITGTLAAADGSSLQYLVTEQVSGAVNPAPYIVTPSGTTLDLATASRSAVATSTVYVLASVVGQPNGLATLDGTGHVPTSQLPSGTGVLSLTAADSSITIAGTGPNPTVAVGAIPESKVTGLTTDLSTLTTSVAAKASKATVRDAYVISGSITPPNTAGAWQSLGTIELDIPASVGDTVWHSWNGMTQPSSSTYYDVALKVGSGLVYFLGCGQTLANLPVPYEGDPGFYQPSGFDQHAGRKRVVVTSGMLDAGNLRFVIAVNSNGVGRFFSEASYPMYWSAENIGPAN